MIKDWQILCRSQQVSNNLDILNSCLWYNPQISKEEMYFSIWFRKGIFLIGDIVNEHSQILPIEALKKKYNFNPNVLDFHRIKLLVQKFIKIFKTGDLFNYTKPARPFHLQILFKSKKGCGDFYKILLKDIVKGPIEVKNGNHWLVKIKMIFGEQFIKFVLNLSLITSIFGFSIKLLIIY